MLRYRYSNLALFDGSGEASAGNRQGKSLKPEVTEQNPSARTHPTSHFQPWNLHETWTQDLNTFQPNTFDKTLIFFCPLCAPSREETDRQREGERERERRPLAFEFSFWEEAVNETWTGKRLWKRYFWKIEISKCLNIKGCTSRNCPNCRAVPCEVPIKHPLSKAPLCQEESPFAHWGTAEDATEVYDMLNSRITPQIWLDLHGKLHIDTYIDMNLNECANNSSSSVMCVCEY